MHFFQMRTWLGGTFLFQMIAKDKLPWKGRSSYPVKTAPAVLTGLLKILTKFHQIIDMLCTATSVWPPALYTFAAGQQAINA